MLGVLGVLGRLLLAFAELICLFQGGAECLVRSYVSKTEPMPTLILTDVCLIFRRALAWELVLRKLLCSPPLGSMRMRACRPAMAAMGCVAIAGLLLLFCFCTRSLCFFCTVCMLLGTVCEV